MKLIISQLFILKNIYFLLFFLSYILKTTFNDLIKVTNCNISLRLFNSYISTFSLFITIIPVYIRTKYLNTTKKEQKQTELTITQTKTSFIYEETDISETKTNNYLIIRTFLIAFFNIMAELSFLVFNIINISRGETEKYYLNSYYVFNIIIQYLICIPILKTSFSRHHFFSFGIISFCLLVYIIIDSIKMSSDNSFQIFFFLMRIIRLSFFAFGNVLGKKTLIENFLTPFDVLLFEGFYNFIILILFSIPFIFIPIKDAIGDEPVILFTKFGNFFYGINILYFLLVALANFSYTLFLWFIIDIYSPSHLVLALILENIGYTIYTMIKMGGKYKYDYIFYINIVFYVLLFFSALVHNEVIIIFLCGLNEKTKYYLNMIALEDVTNTGVDRVDSMLGLQEMEDIGNVIEDIN